MPSLAEIDATIVQTEAAIAALASKRKETNRTLHDRLAKGLDRPAREAQAELVSTTADLEFEENRLVALREARQQAEADDAAAILAAQWAEIEVLAAKRVALAETVEKAVKAAGKGTVALEALSAAIDAKLLAMHVVPNASTTIPDVRDGLFYSLIDAGIPWIIPDGSDARTAGNCLSDRVQRTHGHLASLREQAA